MKIITDFKILMAFSTLLIFAFLTACETKQASESKNSELIAKGEYLVTIGGCNDCHSPKINTEKGPEPNPSLLLSGHPANAIVLDWDTATIKKWLLFSFDGTAAHGPWGTSFAANITSDSTGIGSWTIQQFRNAMQNGDLHGIEGTRKLLPLMPWPTYAKIKSEDIEAIFAYLKSTKPVKNIVPSPLAPGEMPKQN